MMALIDAKLHAVHHAELVMLRNLASTFPDNQFISPENFLTQVAWLGDPAYSSGGGGTSSGVKTIDKMKEQDDLDHM